MALTAQDRLDIQDLIYRCNWANDSGNGGGWSECFAPDGEFDSLGGKVIGREALADFAEQVWSGSDPEWSTFRGGMHCVNNVVIDGDGDQANAKCYLVIFMPTARHEANIILVGYYSDELRKVDGRWYFVRRMLRYWPSDAVRAKLEISAGPRP